MNLTVYFYILITILYLRLSRFIKVLHWQLKWSLYSSCFHCSSPFLDISTVVCGCSYSVWFYLDGCCYKCFEENFSHWKCFLFLPFSYSVTHLWFSVFSPGDRQIQTAFPFSKWNLCPTFGNQYKPLRQRQVFKSRRNKAKYSKIFLLFLIKKYYCVSYKEHMHDYLIHFSFYDIRTL